MSRAAGRIVVLLLCRGLGDPDAEALYGALRRLRTLFDDRVAALFAVTRREEDVAEGKLIYEMPGLRGIIDAEGKVQRRLGAPGHACIAMLDARLRMMAWLGADAPGSDPEALAAQVEALITAEPAMTEAPAAVQAPVLIVPRVFEPALCRRLIEGFETGETVDSGYMMTVDGRIQGIVDHKVKRRSDWEMPDRALKDICVERLSSRLIPQVELAFRFKVTRIERHIVACYDGEARGFFRPHRDNEGDGYRQFAVTLNLNGDYDGGDLRFPEFGRLTYRAPPGGACVFACSLLHEATPVTRGRRFAYLPFLYDEASARRREELNGVMDDPTKSYQYKPLPDQVGRS